MFWNLVTLENTKTLRRSMLWIELAFLALLIVTVFVALFTTSVINANENTPAEQQDALRTSLTWPAGLVEALGLASGNGVGGLLLLILVGATTAQEYTWRTLQLWLSRGVPRSTLLAGKTTAILVPATLIVMTALLVGGLVTGIFTIILDGNLHLEQINIVELLLSVLRTGYSLFPYAGLAFFLGIATRSTAATIGGGLTYLLLLENLLAQGLMMLGGFMAKLSAYIPGSLANSLLLLNKASLHSGASVTAQVQNPILLSPPWAALWIGVWAILFVAAALIIFWQQDLSE